MGCTPSIHVSQTGVVYCRDSDESNSPLPSSLGAPPHALFSASATVVSGSGRKHAPWAVKNAELNSRAVSISEAETQTSHSSMRGGKNEVRFGPMQIKQHTMTIMLVFAKEDAQSDGFWWAADKANFRCSISHNLDSALELYIEKCHDVVIIDNRNPKSVDAEALCRSIRASKCSEHTVIMAVTKKVVGDKEEPSILPLLQVGFNRRFMENSNVSICLNELLTLQLSDVRFAVQQQAAKALLTAVEHSSDVVEITNEDHDIQYVNPAYEKLFGCSSKDVIGMDNRDFPKKDLSYLDLNETFNCQMKKNRAVGNMCSTRAKSVDTGHPHHCRVTPVLGQGGKVRHFVSVKSLNMAFDCGSKTNSTDGYSILDACKKSSRFRKTSVDLSLSSEPVGYNRRQESMARIHSMTIEAPITKVINIINSAQENSPITVVQALDRVLDILRTSELYSPYLGHDIHEDQMTSDLVGGLMTMNVTSSHILDSEREEIASRQGRQQSSKRRLSTTDVHGSLPKSAGLSGQVVMSNSSVLPQVPAEVTDLLDMDTEWDFHILDLERLTNHRPLLYLGLQIFRQFGVLEFLQISETVAASWLQLIEANYQASNSYHNSTHAADVLHATAYFLNRERLKNLTDEMDEVASLIAAIVHDIDHPGFTNAFLINADSKLSLLYNDVAVLESHHASLAFRLTQKDDRVNIFKNLSREDFRAIRQQVIDMVLATEMTKHFEHLSKFVSSINKPASKLDEDSTSFQTICLGFQAIYDITSQSVKIVEMKGRDLHISSRQTTSITSDLSSPENRMLIKRMLIKCADVSNPTRPLVQCQEWAKRIAEEYFRQTDEEKARGLPVVMPVFDRKSCDVPKSQMSFIEFFIMDMFDAWDAFCDVSEPMAHLQINYQHWKEQVADTSRPQSCKSGTESS